MSIEKQTLQLIDNLKATCQKYGLGNDGNEYKIITQVFLYKFVNDKFGYEAKRAKSPFAKKLKDAANWEVVYSGLSEEDRKILKIAISQDVPKLDPEHLLANLWNKQNQDNFDQTFDSTMLDIAEKNADIFSTMTVEGTRVLLFETLTNFVTDTSQRSAFARALVDKLVNFSFEEAFAQQYDFFAMIFEYLIKDYNTAGGGKYAEYYTPHAIATIMARLLAGDHPKLQNMECYDPSAGTGTLLMALAHQIGEDRCTIFSQDISQKSHKMLKLNLLLNGLVSSLDNAIQGDTLLSPYHKSSDGQQLRQFDFIVSNPPFKIDFSETRDQLAAMPVRFWAGVPNVPNEDRSSMPIYLCFLQHVINSLKDTGKAAVVVPTGFLTAALFKGKSSKKKEGKLTIEGTIRKRIVDKKMLTGVISMPSNVFANTGTNVSVLFLDKSPKSDKDNVVLIDASSLGEEYQDANGLKKRKLRDFEVDKIVKTFQDKVAVDDFSVVVSYDQIQKKKYSFAAGQYFVVKIEYVDITAEEFQQRMDEYKKKLFKGFQKSRGLEESILRQIEGLNHE